MKKRYYVITTIVLFASMISNLSKAENMNDALVPVTSLLLKQWVCKADDENEGIYRVCNYFPLEYGNNWKYTTGERTIAESGTCASTGCKGVRYDATNSYEFEPFIQNEKNGFMCTGCQYRNTIAPIGSYLVDLQERIVFIRPEMQIRETINGNYPNLGLTMSTTLIGFESVTVPNGTYNALKFEIVTHDSEECSFKTTLWLAKNIGPVKIHRTEANPADCQGCMFVCRPDNNLVLLNTPAELTSVLINE